MSSSSSEAELSESNAKGSKNSALTKEKASKGVCFFILYSFIKGCSLQKKRAVEDSDDDDFKLEVPDKKVKKQRQVNSSGDEVIFFNKHDLLLLLGLCIMTHSNL